MKKQVQKLSSTEGGADAPKKVKSPKFDLDLDNCAAQSAQYGIELLNSRMDSFSFRFSGGKHFPE